VEDSTDPMNVTSLTVGTANIHSEGPTKDGKMFMSPTFRPKESMNKTHASNIIGNEVLEVDMSR